MNAFKMTGQTPDGKTRVVWGCGKCMRTCHSEEAAVKCCDYHCTQCAAKCTDFFSLCDDCRRKDWERKDRECMDKAEKLPNWDGGVFWNDTYYESVDDAAEAMECHYMADDHWPEFVYVAKPCPPRTIDPDWLYERICDDMGSDDQDQRDYLLGTKELEAAIEAFNEANKAIQWYTEDCTRAVPVPKLEGVSA